METPPLLYAITLICPVSPTYDIYRGLHREMMLWSTWGREALRKKMNIDIHMKTKNILVGTYARVTPNAINCAPLSEVISFTEVS